MRHVTAVCFLSCLLTSGCAGRGFDRGELRRAVGSEPVEVNDAAVARALAIQPQLMLPAAIAVYFEPPREDSSPRAGTFEWRGKDKDMVLAIEKELKAEGVASTVFPIPEMAIRGQSSDPLKNARIAAAQHGADALLVVRGGVQVDTSANPLSILYATIVGLFVAPGTRCDALFLAQGVLWDVRNECLYASAEAEGEASGTRPLAFLGEESRIDEAKAQALAAFSGEILKRVKGLKAMAAGRWTREPYVYATGNAQR